MPDFKDLRKIIDPAVFTYKAGTGLTLQQRVRAAITQVGAGGVVPSLLNLRIMARPESGATPAEGLTAVETAEFAAAAFHARLGFLSMDDFVNPSVAGNIDGTNDVTALVQAAFDAAVVQQIELRSSPGRKYRLTDVITVGSKGFFAPGQLDGSFATFSFDGGHCGHDPNAFGGALRGCCFISEVTDQPAFAIQSMRFSRMRNCSIIGGIVYEYLLPSFDPDDYTAGFRTDRYSPHAGIAIDPYTGSTPPGGGYSGATYLGGTGSFYCLFEKVRVQGFVAGVVIQPSGGDANASTVRFSDGQIDQCAYGYSVCGSQNRNQLIENTSIDNCHVAVTNSIHGLRFGSLPKIWGGEWTYLARMFEVSSNVDVMECDAVYTEGVRSIGWIGRNVFSAPSGAVFNGCNFNLFGGTGGFTAPCILDHSMPVSFVGCNITTEDSCLGIVSRLSPAQFTSCLFYVTNGDGWAWFPNQSTTRLPELRGCSFFSQPGARGSGLAATAPYGINQDGYCTRDEFKFSKSIRYLPTARRITTDQNTFELRMPRDVVNWTGLSRLPYVPAATDGAYTFGETTCSFNATDGTDFAVGDILLWSMNALSVSVQGHELPALRVTAIATNAITCALVYSRDAYDETVVATTVKILPKYWAANPAVAPLWGQWTSGSATVNFSGIDPRDYLEVGDFVFQQESSIARGLYRVRSLTASTAVLSKNAGGSSSSLGSPVTFGECARQGGRFQTTFVNADLISSQYVLCNHGMQGRLTYGQVFDSAGVIKPLLGIIQRGSGVVALDLGAATTVSGTWTFAGVVTEIEE